MVFIADFTEITDEDRAVFKQETAELSDRLTVLENREDTEITYELQGIVQVLNRDIGIYSNKWMGREDSDMRVTAFREVIERFTYWMELHHDMPVVNRWN